MTRISFHLNMPDKLGYACRLLRKACNTGTPAGVTAPADVTHALDTLLWRFSALDFIPHCLASAPEAMRRASPIVLAQACAELPDAPVLLNLGDTVPEGFERFARLIELVSTDPDDRALARQRWRHYTRLGYGIEQHDLALPQE